MILFERYVLLDLRICSELKEMIWRNITPKIYCSKKINSNQNVGI